jgi:ribosomal protein L34E
VLREVTAEKAYKTSYNTVSNRVRVIKTPGGHLRYLHVKKKGTAPKCGDCGSKLTGVSEAGDGIKSGGS